VDVTINYLDLDEAAGDYLIISPGKKWLAIMTTSLWHDKEIQWFLGKNCPWQQPGAGARNKKGIWVLLSTKDNMLTLNLREVINIRITEG
jgi:hypothetical protein